MAAEADHRIGIPDFEAHIRRRIDQSRSVYEALLEPNQIRLVAQVAEWIVETYRKQGKVLLFGNGGSAADAQHIAAELGGRYYLDRAPLPALALHANTSLVTAIGNDTSFGRIFAQQVEALATPADLVIGISTSGNSENVIEGIRAARRKGSRTVGLTGSSGGRLKELVDGCIAVPSADTPRIQEAHILIGHIICELVENRIFSPAGS
jgi:D-sedoheptulose 7-phosphate isomerase